MNKPATVSSPQTSPANNNQAGPAVVEKPKFALNQLAARLAVKAEVLEETLKKTAFKECKTNEEFVAAVIVANTYGLNPLLKEMYVFPAKGGGIMPIVSIDGWISLVQRQPNYNGHEFENTPDETQPGKIGAITCKIHIKGRDFPAVHTEYMRECYSGNKEPWKQWPIRMLTHKAFIQCARYAFGFSGIYEEDERDRYVDVASKEADKPMVSLKSPQAVQPAPAPSTESQAYKEQASEVKDAQFTETAEPQTGLFGDINRFNEKDREAVAILAKMIAKVVEEQGPGVLTEACNWEKVDLKTTMSPSDFATIHKMICKK